MGIIERDSYVHHRDSKVREISGKRYPCEVRRCVNRARKLRSRKVRHCWSYPGRCDHGHRRHLQLLPFSGALLGIPSFINTKIEHLYRLSALSQYTWMLVIFTLTFSLTISHLRFSHTSYACLKALRSVSVHTLYFSRSRLYFI